VDKATGAVSVLRLPSKRQALHLAEDSLIFRSDSNGEDLEGFAGAGAPCPAAGGHDACDAVLTDTLRVEVVRAYRAGCGNVSARCS
jgi:hypothetical protein